MYEPILDGNKIPRKYLAHFLDAAMPGATMPIYGRLGDDLEEYNAEMSATVDKKKNILGQTAVNLSAYEKTGTVEPYFAKKGTPLFIRLKDIVDNEKMLDDCNSTIVDVELWEDPAEPESTVFPAIRHNVVIEVTSYGGDTTGVQIPFNLHYTGAKTKGTFDIVTKEFAVTT